MFLYGELYTITQTLIFSFFPRAKESLPESAHKHTEHPKSRISEHLSAKDRSSNNGISKYVRHCFVQ